MTEIATFKIGSFTVRFLGTVESPSKCRYEIRHPHSKPFDSEEFDYMIDAMIDAFGMLDRASQNFVSFLDTFVSDFEKCDGSDFELSVLATRVYTKLTGKTLQPAIDTKSETD